MQLHCDAVVWPLRAQDTNLSGSLVLEEVVKEQSQAMVKRIERLDVLCKAGRLRERQGFAQRKRELLSTRAWLPTEVPSVRRTRREESPRRLTTARCTCARASTQQSCRMTPR